MIPHVAMTLHEGDKVLAKIDGNELYFQTRTLKVGGEERLVRVFKPVSLPELRCLVCKDPAKDPVTVCDTDSPHILCRTCSTNLNFCRLCKKPALEPRKTKIIESFETTLEYIKWCCPVGCKRLIDHKDLEQHTEQCQPYECFSCQEKFAIAAWLSTHQDACPRSVAVDQASSAIDPREMIKADKQKSILEFTFSYGDFPEIPSGCKGVSCFKPKPVGSMDIDTLDVKIYAKKEYSIICNKVEWHLVEFIDTCEDTFFQRGLIPFIVRTFFFEELQQVSVSNHYVDRQTLEEVYRIYIWGKENDVVDKWVNLYTTRLNLQEMIDAQKQYEKRIWQREDRCSLFEELPDNICQMYRFFDEENPGKTFIDECGDAKAAKFWVLVTKSDRG